MPASRSCLAGLPVLLAVSCSGESLHVWCGVQVISLLNGLLKQQRQPEMDDQQRVFKLQAALSLFPIQLACHAQFMSILFWSGFLLLWAFSGINPAVITFLSFVP